MSFNIWTFLFEVLNFLVLVAILRWLLYRPLHEAIDRRREANAKAQADAEKARQEAASLQQQLNAELEALGQHRQELIRKSHEQIEAERKATMAEVERVAQHRRESAEQQLERERDEALRTLHEELVQSAKVLAERFLRSASNSTLQEQLAGRLIEELQQIPADDRQRLRAELESDETAVVETTEGLDNETLRDLHEALESLAGRAMSLSVQARPELIGGLRLRVGGHIWDASLAGGLDGAAPTSSGGVPA